MKKIIRCFLFGFPCFLILISCSSSNGEGGMQPIGSDMGNGNNDIQAPTAATLIFPEADAECNEGTVKSDTESTVTFQWNASLHTDSYVVTLANLNTGNSFESISNNNEAEIILERGVPYEWFVVSSSNGTTETATSETWRFYNEGSGVGNYAPFPPEVVGPMEDAALNTETVALIWKATDIDNDIKGYEVFFGLKDSSLESLGTQIENDITIAIQTDSEYQWQVKVIDASGNSTYSPIFRFRTL